MKLSFSEKIKISPIINKNKPLSINNTLYTQYDNTIVITNVLDGKILDKIEFGNISCFTIKGDLLYIANTKIIVYSISEKKIIETLEVGTILINNIEVEDSIYISCIDGSLKKIINKYAVKIAFFNNPILSFIVRNDKVIAHDGSVVKVLVGSKIDFEVSAHSIKDIDYDKEVYYITDDGNLFRGKDVILETGMHTQGLVVCDDKIVLCVSSYLYFYSKDLQFIEKRNLNVGEIKEQQSDNINRLSDGEVEMLDESDDDNLDDYDDEELKSDDRNDDNFDDDDEELSSNDSNDDDIKEVNVTNSEESSTFDSQESSEHSEENNFIVKHFTNNLIHTASNEIYILSKEFVVKNLIVGNIDEITSMKTKDDLIVIASSSDRIFYTYRDYYENGEYVFRGFLLEGHSDTVMSISILDDKMLSTSRDGTAILWTIRHAEEDYNINNEDTQEHDSKRFKSLYKRKQMIIMENKFECGQNGQNTCAIDDNLLVVGGDEGMIYFFNTKENILTKKIHNKEINCLLIFKERKMIITASQDKDIKVLDYSSKILHTLSGHRKGVISLSLGSRYLASCSLDKTIRLWDLNDWECVSVLEGHDSGVLSTVFYKNNIVSACITGGLKTWNLSNKKCENNLKLPSKVWSLGVQQDELFVSSSEYLLIYKDESQKKSLEILEKETIMAKQKIAIEKSVKDNNYNELLELIKDTKDYKTLFKAISKLVQDENTFLSLEKLSKQQIYKVIQENAKLKNIKTNNLMLNYLIQSKKFASKDVMKDLEKRVVKEFEAIDTIYRRLVSYDIFFDINS